MEMVCVRFEMSSSSSSDFQVTSSYLRNLSDIEFDRLWALLRKECTRRTTNLEPYDNLKKWTCHRLGRFIYVNYVQGPQDDWICTLTLREGRRAFSFCGVGSHSHPKNAKEIARNNAARQALESTYMSGRHNEIPETQFISILRPLLLSFLIEGSSSLEQLVRFSIDWYGESCPYSNSKLSTMILDVLEEMRSNNQIYREHSISWREDSPYLYVFTTVGRSYLYARASEIKDMNIRSQHHMGEYRCRLRKLL